MKKTRHKNQCLIPEIRVGVATKKVLPRNHHVEIFGESINKEPEFLSKFSHKHLRMTVNNPVFAVFDLVDFITPRLVISEN